MEYIKLPNPDGGIISMNRYSRALLALAVGMVCAIASGQSAQFAQGEVLVKFRGPVQYANSYANMANSAIRAQSLRAIKRINTHQIKLPAGMSVMDAVAYYKRLPYVQYAEPNYKKDPYFVPNDPRFNQQFGPTITKCPEAWDLTQGSASVIIAIIDSGIEASHEDFAGKLVPGFDFSDNDPNPDWTDSGVGDHGVHVAGIAGAATNNAKGVAGTGFNCKIMPLKIFPNSFDSVSAAAIIHAADNGAKVINMSYGSGFPSQTELDAVNYAWSRGVVLVAASGNDGSPNQGYPAAFPNVIAVGATNSQDLITGFTTGNDTWLDVVAPGEDIMSTVGGNTYANNTGTSMASPMTAGIVGLLWSIAIPGTTNAQVRQALESTTDAVANNNGKSKFGRVNALKAVQAMDPGSATISDVVGVTMWTGANASGSATDLNTSDQNFFTVLTAETNLGQVGGAIVDIAFNGDVSNLRESLLFLEANGPTAAAGQVYLWNYATSKYTLVKAFPMRPTGVKRERINIPKNLTNYVSGGNLRLGIRAVGANRLPRMWPHGPFDFKLGFVQVSTRPSS